MYDIIFQSLCQPLMYALTTFFVFCNVFCRKELFFPPISEIKSAEFIFFHRIFPLCRFNKPGVKQHFQISVFLPACLTNALSKRFTRFSFILPENIIPKKSFCLSPILFNLLLLKRLINLSVCCLIKFSEK